jgi:hypothetical protein
MNDPITVLRVSRISGQGNLRALAVAQVGEFEIRGLRIVMQPGQRPYMAWPQLEHRRKFYSMLKTEPALRERVQAAVLAAWKMEVGA